MNRTPLWPVMTALLAAIASLAAAEDDGWDDIQEQRPDNNHNNFLADPNNFEQWVFQHTSNAKAQRKRFLTQLELSIRELDSACLLDPSQKQRLELAGQLDIENFFAEYYRVRDEIYSGETEQEDFNNVWQLIQPLQMQVQSGLIDQESLLRKVSRNTLTPTQSEAFARTEHARRLFHYRAAVGLYLMMIDSTMPLNASQREAVTELVLRETKPPNKCVAQSQQLYVQFQLSQLDPEAIRAVVSGEQGDLLVKLFRQGRGFEHHLKQQGIRPHDE